MQQWYQVLTDTLLGFEVPPFTETSVRKAIATSKFYFFDTGIVRALRDLPTIPTSSQDFGGFFDHFIGMELRAWIDYRSPRTPLNFWRSTSAFEVDFIIGKKVAVEVKSTTKVTDRHLKGLRALKEEKLLKRYVLVCQELTPRKIDGIEILPWKTFLKELWQDGLV